MSSRAPTSSRGWWWLLQLLVSAIVLAALVRAIEPSQLRALPGRLRWGLLLAAVALKAATLLLHELRVWMVLPAPRPPLLGVTRIGLISGMVNLILPGRAGDLLNIALLQRRFGVGLGAATAAMGLVTLLEAAVFGSLLLVGLTLGAAQWQALLGADAHERATLAVGLATAGGLLGLTAVAAVGRRLTRSAPSAPRGPGLRQLLREATASADAALGSPRNAAANLGLSLLQVVGMVAAFAVALPAVGVQVSTPFFAAAGVLGLSSIASMVLPAGYGAGPAAASLAVLSTMGADEADALAYAGAWWVLSQVPAVLFGLPSMWRTGLRLRDTQRLTR